MRMLKCSGEVQKPFSTILESSSNSSDVLQSYAGVLPASMPTASSEPHAPPLIRLSSIIKMLANYQGH